MLHLRPPQFHLKTRRAQAPGEAAAAPARIQRGARRNTTWWRRRRRLALVSLAVVAATVGVDLKYQPRLDTKNTHVRSMGALQEFEQYAYNGRMKVYGDFHEEKARKARARIAIVSIGDSTFREFDGPPLHRRHHASLVRDLTRAGARAIAFDLLFLKEAEDPWKDDEPLMASARASQNVVWGSLFDGEDGAQTVLRHPLPAYTKANPFVGYINSGQISTANGLIDRMSVVRRHRDGQQLSSFVFTAARLAERQGRGPLAPVERVGNEWRSGRLRVPTDDKGDFGVAFLGQRSVKAADANDNGHQTGEALFQVVPFEEIALGRLGAQQLQNAFAGKIVLVGDTTKLNNDYKGTPIGELPGVEIHANALATILTNSYIRAAPQWANIAAIALLGLAVIPLAAARRLKTTIALTLAVAAAFVLFNVWLFVRHGVWLHFIAPMLALVGATLGTLVEGGLFQERERERMFHAFVTASASAIESRDPATAGHSDRVTAFAVGLAHAVNATRTGPYKSARFSPQELKELEYAGLLHDFGKIGVRESILSKSHKLEPRHFEAVLARLDAARASLSEKGARDKLQVLAPPAHQAPLSDEHKAARLAEIERECEEKTSQMDRDREYLKRSNDPMVTFLPDAEYAALQEVLGRLEVLFYVDADGARHSVIDADEKVSLSIRKGSLTHSEFRSIQEHAQLSYDFLRQIPWTDAYAAIPDIAWTHHEKLNARGYPRALGASDISLQARIMTIADIFDALTASDRPYKKAMPVERALKILREEADMGALDRDLVAIFEDHKVHESVLAAGGAAAVAPPARVATQPA